MRTVSGSCGTLSCRCGDSGTPDTVPSTQGSFTFDLINGDGAGHNVVSSAVIKVNGTTIVGTRDLNENVLRITTPLTNLVQGTNSLSVSVPGSILGGEVNRVWTGLPNQYSDRNEYKGWDAGIGVGIGLPVTPQVFTGYTGTLHQGRYK